MSMLLEYVYTIQTHRKKEMQRHKTHFIPCVHVCMRVCERGGSSFDSRFVDFCGHTNNH